MEILDTKKENLINSINNEEDDDEGEFNDQKETKSRHNSEIIVNTNLNDNKFGKRKNSQLASYDKEKDSKDCEK